MAYNEIEKIVLENTFTNLDDNIYCVWSSMPGQLWAFLSGAYSRTHKTMRDRFLQLFSDQEKAFEEGRIKKDDFVSLEDYAKALQNKDFEKIKYFEKRAANFLSKWAIEFKHESIMDHDVEQRYALEEVSILATKAIEDGRLAAYTESSTRYLFFDKQSIYVDPVLARSEFAGLVKQSNDMLMDFYVESKEVIVNYLKAKFTLEEFREKALDNDPDLSEKKIKTAYETTINAQAFDSVRYLLPIGTKTKLGSTMNSRQARHAISKLLTSDLHEMQHIGKRMQEEGSKISVLLKDINPSEYRKMTNSRMKALADSLLKGTLDDEVKSNHITLVDYDTALEKKLAAAMLFEYTKLPHHKIMEQAKDFSNEQIETVFSNYLKGRDIKEAQMRATEIGDFVFDIVLDYGAYRDLQRHRIGTQLKQKVTCDHGYETPDLFIESGLQKKYDEVMQKNAEIFYTVAEVFPDQAQYIPALGHRTRYLYKIDPRQATYNVELRSAPQGHTSYRKIVIAMHKAIEKVAPIYAKFIRVNKDKIDLARADASIIIESKRQKLEGS